MFLFAVVRFLWLAQRRRQQEEKVVAAFHGHVPTYNPAPIEPQPPLAPPVPALYPVPTPAPYPVPVPYPVPAPYPAAAPYPVPTSHPFNYYSAPVTHDDQTPGEMNRPRQVDSSMPVYEQQQQQHRPDDAIREEDGPPPEYQLTASGASESWQPTPGPSLNRPPATPQGKKGG